VRKFNCYVVSIVGFRPLEPVGVVAATVRSSAVAAAYIGNIELPVSSYLLTLIKIPIRMTTFYRAVGRDPTQGGHSRLRYVRCRLHS
jgi:hypothetical protein